MMGKAYIKTKLIVGIEIGIIYMYLKKMRKTIKSEI